MTRRAAAATVVGLAGLTLVSLMTAPPATAASEDLWKVTAMHSQKGWKDSKPKAPILRACRTGQNASGIGLGTPVAVLTEGEQVIGTAPVTKVTVWREVGRWICRFTANVPVATNTESMFLVRTADTPALMVFRGDVRADGWTVAYWPD